MTMIALLGDLDDTAQTTAAITLNSVNEEAVTYKGVPVAIVPLSPGTEPETHNHGDTQYNAIPFGGSSTVTIAGRPVHRIGDSRSCLEHYTETKIPGEVRTVNIFT